MKKVLRLSSILLVVAFLFTLVSCAPKDAAAGREKMEGKGYTVVTDGTIIPAALKLLGVNGVETVLTCSKSKDDKNAESLVAILFAEKSQAKDSSSKVQDYAKKNGYESGVVVAGKWVIYGSDQAVKDFK